MALRDGLVVGAMHHLIVGNCDTVSLAEEYDTPLYVLDENYIRAMCKAFVEALATYAPGGVAYYASKAFLTEAMCHIVAQEGMGLDVVSGGELYSAQKAGFPMERVTMHGNCKTPDELAMAVSLGVGQIVIDSRDEIHALQSIAAAAGKQVNVLIRLNPDIDAHTHDAIKTAVDDCKFGLGVDNGEALAAVKAIAACPNLEMVGVHVHIGSQIFELDPFLTAVERLMNFLMLASMTLGRELAELVIGGGFGVHYTKEDPPTVNPREAVRLIAQAVRSAAETRGMRVPRLVLEPGRIIVAEAGLMLYTVNHVKTIPNVRTYVGIDGGMMDNPRVALYGAKYEALLANRADERPNGEFAIAGRACESGDVLGMDFLLPTPAVGDVLAIPTAGAYQYSMASNYNRVPVPAVVLVKNGRSALIVRRQTYADVAQYDQIPGWFSD